MEAQPPARAYDALANAYDDAQKGARWELYDELTWESVAPWLPPPGARVLDAGAGSGKFALRFLARGDEVTLLDPSRAMLDVAERKVRERGLAERARFVVGGIERMDLPDASFDLVFCEGDPLSYCLGREREAARELLRVLRPGGAFYVSVDNRWIGALGFLARGDAARAWAAIERGDSIDPYGLPVHAFEPEELRALLVDAGATDVRVAGKVALLNFVPDAALAPLLSRPDERARLLALEARLATDARFAALAGHLHATGRKGGA